MHDGDYRSDATFSVSPSGSPSRSAPCLVLRDSIGVSRKLDSSSWT
jgi:hypothetical protein